MKKERTLKVRITKSNAVRKEYPRHKEEKKEEPAKPKYLGEMDERKKKIMIGASITVIMLIIFITWFSLLGRNLSQAQGDEQGFWQRIIGNLRTNFEDIKDSYDKATTSLQNLNSGNMSGNTNLEQQIFPKTK